MFLDLTIYRYRIHEDGVFRCFEAAKAVGYKIVGIGDGKCWSGAHAQKFYKVYRPSLACKNGLGGNGSYDIYLVNSKYHRTWLYGGR